jgi:thioredoxin-dependent peroxiredoxin
MSLNLGDSLPDISLTASNDQQINLAALRGQILVLYFYPRDDTPGCTQEGKDFRDLYPQFQSRNAIILGVSRDELAKHKRFQQKYAFPFELLADTEELLCQHFAVIKNKKMFGKEVLGIERSTFLFDQHGILRRIWRKVKVEGHATAVLQAIDELQT